MLNILYCAGQCPTRKYHLTQNIINAKAEKPFATETISNKHLCDFIFSYLHLYIFTSFGTLKLLKVVVWLPSSQILSLCLLASAPFPHPTETALNVGLKGLHVAKFRSQF